MIIQAAYIIYLYDYSGCLRALATNFKMTHCAPGDFIIRNLFVLLLRQ